MSRKVAIIHDWLLHYRGGERVLEAIAEMYPEADIFTLFYRPGAVSPSIEKHRIIPSFLNSIPGAHKFYRYLLPLFPMAVERWNLSDYDLVISSSHCVAKGVITPPHAHHVCYLYTPMRYAWDQYWNYFGGRAAEWLLFPFLHYLRMWDVTSSRRVDRYFTISQSVARRASLYYGRNSDVLPVFVDLNVFEPLDLPVEDFYLVASALVPYKKIDVAIEACRKLNRRLVIIGEGPELARLTAMAGPNVFFAGKVPTETLRKAYATCRALLFPGEEDFGIVPLEAMAMGRPVIAYGRGGVLDTVIDGETGILYDPATAEGLVEAIEELERGPAFSPVACIRQAREFTRGKFQERFQRLLAAPTANRTTVPSQFVSEQLPDSPLNV